MKLMPGVRLNFNKNSVGMSFGVPGARYTVNSKGRRTVTAGIPGTGLYNVETLSSGRRSSAASRATSASSNVPGQNQSQYDLMPGIFARKAERKFYKYLLDIFESGAEDTPDQAIEKATALQTLYPTLNYSLGLLKFLYSIKGGAIKNEDALEMGMELWNKRQTAFADKYVRKYFQGIKPQVSITPGISTSSVYTSQTLGHILVELLQEMGKYEEAIELLHQLQPDQLVAISLADIEISTKDFDGAIATTEDIENDDDATAMLLVLRGVAFREKGLNEGALECFKRALASKKRSEVLRHRALFERAETYSRLGKKALAIKDLEKILVEDSDYPAVQEKLDALNS